MKKQYIKPSAALFSVCGNTAVLAGLDRSLGKYSIDTCANEWMGKERDGGLEETLPMGHDTTNGSNGINWDF